MPLIDDLVFYQASNVVVTDVNVLSSRIMGMILQDIDCTKIFKVGSQNLLWDTLVFKHIFQPNRLCEPTTCYYVLYFGCGE